MINIKYKRLSNTAHYPTYAKYGDAGADLYADEVITISPGNRALVRTGIALEIPYGFVGLVHPRSGLAHKHGISVVNAPGTVDAGYRGEIFVNLINHGDLPVTFKHNDRIAQLLIQPIETGFFLEVDELSESVRGDGGHGSTGGFNGRI